MNIGFAVCGSFCTYEKVFPIMEKLAEETAQAMCEILGVTYKAPNTTDTKVKELEAKVKALESENKSLNQKVTDLTAKITKAKNALN